MKKVIERLSLQFLIIVNTVCILPNLISPNARFVVAISLVIYSSLAIYNLFEEVGIIGDVKRKVEEL